MLITRIIAKNFKTYNDLNLDLSVSEDKPIILIGGENGGGKTTLFQAIYAALYGLEIHTELDFKKLQNAGALAKNLNKITLEIHFVGKVLTQNYTYILQRTYILNDQKQPVEAVILNLNGDIFQYGTASAPAQRKASEAEVNKIIKANLPQELSRYFLFDAMKAGDLLEKEYLNKVIKENIENVMGFNKYLQLGATTKYLLEKETAQSLKNAADKANYLRLTAEKKKEEEHIIDLNEELKRAFEYALSEEQGYKTAKEGKEQHSNIQQQIKIVTEQIDVIFKRESDFATQGEAFLKEIELQVFIPKLINIIHNEMEVIFAERKQQPQNEQLDLAQLNVVADSFLVFLEENNLLKNSPESTKEAFITYFLEKVKNENTNLGKYDFLDKDDITTLEKLVGMASNNSFTLLEQQKASLEKEIINLPNLQIKLLNLQNTSNGGNEEIIRQYENNTQKINLLKETIKTHENNTIKLNKEISQYDLSDGGTPNPKLELLKKLTPFFAQISTELLKNKKANIETAMKTDLNIMLISYKNQIEKVTLAEDLSNFSFKIYHKAGNEIYLDQLNAASKQIIIQVLLKSLHKYGDYEPPVMIDTVFGFLDKDSRALLLENYFPQLSHQTILLSTDTEIRKNIDLEKLEGFISKKYTLKRDVENQATNVYEGYFEK